MNKVLKNSVLVIAFCAVSLTMPAQRMLITILDSIFAKEQQAKAAAEQVIDQIDTMKKAILARAFRGELSTNDPTEESAEGLLKSIM